MHDEHWHSGHILRLVPDLLDFKLIAVDGNLQTRPHVLVPVRHIVTVNCRRDVKRPVRVNDLDAVKHVLDGVCSRLGWSFRSLRQNGQNRRSGNDEAHDQQKHATA
ncbi:MAG: hypothetical protein HY314_00725 [Acidobacteria bacterium]|nr:hypothetical protein [Acidobacteriota bacterium]